MIALRRIGLVLGILVLHIGLGLFVLAAVFTQLFSSPEPVKQSLTDVNAYTATQRLIVERSAQEAESTGTGVGTNDPRFVEIAKNALSAQAIQAEASQLSMRCMLGLRVRPNSQPLALISPHPVS